MALLRRFRVSVIMLGLGAVLLVLAFAEHQPIAAVQADAPTPSTWRFDFVRQWAHQPPLGIFNIPSGITFDKVGNLYVVDEANHRIQVLNRQGVAIRAFGQMGDGPGDLYRPGHVAVDSQGYVYVADRGNDRIVKFAPDGTPVAHFDDFVNPWGIAVGSDDTLYVSDNPSFSPQRRGRLHRLAPDGSDHRIIREEVSGLGSLKVKREGGSDVIYVLTAGGIVGYTPDGAVLTQYAQLDLHVPVDFEIDRVGNLYIADQAGNQVVVRSGRDGSTRVWVGFATPRALAVGPDNLIYVVDGEGGNYGSGRSTLMRIQRFTPMGEVVEPTWGSDEGRAEGQLVYPDAIAWSPTGHIWVHDNADGRFQRFTPTGDFDLQAPASVDLRAISFMRADNQGNLLVSQGCRIMRLAPTGALLQTYENSIPCALPTEDPTTIFSWPLGFDVDSADNLYVTDFRNHRAVKLDRQGNLLRTYGEVKTLNKPVDVAVGPAGAVYVLDEMEYSPPDHAELSYPYSRIQVFSAEGALQASWTVPDKSSQRPVDDALLAHIEVDNAGYVYVADLSALTIRKLDPISGDIVASIEPGGSGAGPGRFDSLSSMKGFALAPSGEVYTVEGIPNARVQVFGQTAITATPTATASPSATLSTTATPTTTASATLFATATSTSLPTATSTLTVSVTPSATASATLTPAPPETTVTPTTTQTAVPTATATDPFEVRPLLYLPYLVGGR